MRSLLALTSILCLAVACGDDDGPPADTGRDVPANVDTNRQDTNMQDTNGQDTNMQDANSSGMCPASHMCDLVSQDCSGDDGCYFGVDMDGNSLGVCASPGTAAFGETCDAAAACVAGLSCIGGTCVQACCGSNDHCTMGGECIGRIQGEDTVGFCVTFDNCDIVAQTGCEEGEGCYESGENNLCTTAGSAAVGAACQRSNDCAPGNICVRMEGQEPACQDACNPANGSNDCNSGQQCGALRNRPNLGICFTP